MSSTKPSQHFLKKCIWDYLQIVCQLADLLSCTSLGRQPGCFVFAGYTRPLAGTRMVKLRARRPGYRHAVSLRLRMWLVCVCMCVCVHACVCVCSDCCNCFLAKSLELPFQLPTAIAILVTMATTAADTAAAAAGGRLPLSMRPLLHLLLLLQLLLL